MTATTAQISKMHVLAKQGGLDDAAYRAVIERATGKRSAKLMTAAEAGRAIEALAAFAPDQPDFDRASNAPPANGAMRLEGPYVGVLRALWIAGWNLGVIRDRSDRALVAFVAEQSKVDSPGWLDAKTAKASIEALKAWLARDAGVIWPKDGSARDRKRAIVAAQMAMLDPLVVAERTAVALDILPDRALDAKAMELGRQVRKLRGRG